MPEVTLLCKGSKRLPIVCMSHWEGDGGGGGGGGSFKMTSP